MGNHFVEREDVIQWLDYMTGRLDEYEVERNEYLAAYREQAPASFRFFQDVVLGFTENTLLMDNLAAGREEIRFVRDEENELPQNRLRIHTTIKESEIKAHYPDAEAITPGDSSDQSSICYPDNFPYLLRNCNFEEKETKNFDTTELTYNLNQVFKNKEIEGEDVEVVLPNPHVFYSILENFIRNSAKHSKHLNGKDKLEIYISVIDPGDEAECYDVILGDNASEVTVEEAIDFQYRIEEDLLGRDAERKGAGLGISDMKFSSFLMCDPEPGEMDEVKLSKHLSVVAFHDQTGKATTEEDYILLSQDEDNDDDKDSRIENLKEELGAMTCNFGYRFRLVKSKKVCWIGSHLDDNDTELRKHGIYGYSSLDKFQDPDGQRTIAAFDFAVIEQDALTGIDGKAEFEQALSELPYRVLLVQKKNGDSRPGWLGDWLATNEQRVQLTDDDLPALQSDQLLRWCWCEWLQRWDIGVDDRRAKVRLYTESEVDGWCFAEETDFCEVDFEAFSEDEINDMNDSGDESPMEASSDDALIVYDRHGGLMDNFSGGDILESISEPPNFVNSFDKNSADFSRLYYPPDREEEKEHMVYELVESGLTRILVLDERIAKLAGKKVHISMTDAVNLTKGDFWHQAAAANVFFVTHTDVGGERSEVAKGRTINKALTEFTLTLADSADDDSLAYRYSYRYDEDEWTEDREATYDVSDYADVLVIHRTFVKSLAKQMYSSNVKALIKRLRQHIPWIVIDSGTSHSLDVESQFKFLPFSQLDDSIERVGPKCIISKNRLTKRIMTLT